MRAIFLAGGISRRMWPLSWDKNLVGFLGKPLMAHTLEGAQKVGIEGVVLVGRKENLGFFKKIGKSLGFQTETVGQDKNLKGQAGAILSAKKYLKGEILICNANDVFDLKLYRDILRRIKNSKPDALLVGYKVRDYFPGGYLKIDNSKVLEIVEKPAPDKVPSDMVRIVADYFAKGEELVENLERIKVDPDKWYEEAINQMIKGGKKVSCLPYRGTWKFLKYPWHLLDLMEYFFQKGLDRRVAKTARVSPQAKIDGKVIIEDGVRVLEGAIIRGPAYIGGNAIIGNYALVRESIIGEGSVVGYASEITRSYIGKNCWFHTNYVGDSVIDDNVSFGSGAITANLRLDEGEIKSVVQGEKVRTGRDKLGAIIGRDARIGVNAMIMPGVKIGQNSVVGPGVILGEDLEDKSFCVVKQVHKITKNRLGITVKSRDKFRQKL